MKTIVYTRFDKTGNFFNPIQCANTDKIEEFLEQNRRACVRLTDKAQTAYIADLSLFHVGYFDDTTGKVELLPEPVKLCDCAEWLGAKHE